MSPYVDETKKISDSGFLEVNNSRHLVVDSGFIL